MKISKAKRLRLEALTKEWEQRVYLKEEIIGNPNYMKAIEEAEAKWRQLCDEFVAQKGDIGSCIKGWIGFYVYCLKPRRRIPSRLFIVQPYFGYQGECVWYTSKDVIEDMLTKAGLEVSYECGALD
jgi:hypothetical protein